MACSAQCLPALHHLPEFAQVHVSDAVQLHSPQFVSNLSSFFVLTIVSVQRKVKKWGHEAHCRFDPWVGKMPWRRKWQPSPVFLLGEFHGQRSLAGYSPWARKESDTTKQLTTTAGTKLPGSLNVAKMPLFAEIQVPWGVLNESLLSKFCIRSELNKQFNLLKQ